MIEKNIIIVLFILLANFTKGASQAVAGAQIHKEFYNSITKKLKIKVEVTRSNTSKDFIIFDWGDGQIDTIQLALSINDGSFFIIDYYIADHNYDLEDSTGYYLLSFTEDQIIDDYANIDYTDSNVFTIIDSILIFNEYESPDISTLLNIGSRPNTIDVDTFLLFETVEYGIDFYHSPLDIDLLVMSLDEFPVNGYYVPAQAEELYVIQGLLVWNRPLFPGKYAFAVKIRELRGVNNVIYDDSIMMVSTMMKAFTIIVDSSDIVSTVGTLNEIAILSIYPNPAQNHLQIQYGGLVGELQLQISNAQGQLMYKQPLAGTTRLQTQQIDISNWPAGIYFIEIENEKGRLVRKLVVE